jgi:hypothetical protein
MRIPLRSPTLLAVWTLATFGCSGDRNPPPAAASPQEAVPSLQASFQAAPEEIKQEAESAVTAIQSQDDTAAFLRLENLSKRSELTAEQRQAMVDAWMAVNRRLAAAASNGNPAAEELLNHYRSTK